MAQDDIAYFQAIPWTSALLSDSNLRISPTTSRTIKPTTEDALIGQTLHNKSTIPFWLTLYSLPAASRLPSQAPVTSLLTLLALKYGVNGFKNMVHRGLICVIMDEAMGQLLMVNKHHDPQGKWNAMATGELKTRYLRAVQTPQVVLVRATVRNSERRKCWVDAQIEDGQGCVLARSEAIWVVVGGKEARTKL